MKELLNKALDQLRIAKVTINPRSLKKQISLFEIDDSQEVEFNGWKYICLFLSHILIHNGENGHVDHPKTEYVDQLFSFV